MKKIYNWYISKIERFLEKNQVLKMWIAEHFALWQKRNLSKDIIWSKKQEKDFNAFWVGNYKKVNENSIKFFQAFNNTFNPSYVPDYLYATKIEPTLNSYLYSKIYSDKALLDILYKERSNALTPTTLLLNSGGIMYDSERHIITEEQAKNILLKIRTAIIKPTVGGNSGKGVLLGKFDKNGFDANLNFDIFSLLSPENKNFIVQEKIIQSKELDELYPNSINTFRVITFIAEGAVQLAPISLRLGTGGNFVDNIHAGGLAVGVNEVEGVLMKYAYQLGYSNNKTRFTEHPDTKVIFENFKVTGLDEIIIAAKRLHELTPNTRIISWDFAINQAYKPVLIEANYIGQAVWLSQITTGQSIFRGFTASVLKQI